MNSMTTFTNNDDFDGDFDFLPVASMIELGAIPSHPTSDDFQLAAMTADDSPIARWRCEAIRYRRQHPAAALDESALKAIANSVAGHLYRVAMETA